MSKTPVIRVHNLRKSFEDVEVLRGVNLKLYKGEKAAMIGPSGSGKSTLLRVLMTLDEPSAGTVEVNGQSVWTIHGDDSRPADEQHLRSIRGDIGMVFQHFNLFPHMTALRNVALSPQHVLGLARKEAEQRARELLKRVGLEEKAAAYPGELSGGQKQRVAIARALAMQPSVMLFDEITSALDPELVEEVLGVLRGLASDADMAMLIVTHEIHFAREIADRVLFIDEGKIVEDAPPVKIFNDPDHPRTREFLRRELEL